MQLCDTKDNHYVPQFYLKSFLDKNLYIYFFDKETKNYRSTQKLKEIAFKTHLYTVKNKINQMDVLLFKKIFQLSISNDFEQMFLNWLMAFLNDELKKLFTLKHKYDKEIEIKVNDVIKNLLDGPDFSRNQELLFTFYENKFQSVCNEIIKTEKLFLRESNQYNPISYLAFGTLGFIMKMMVKKMSLIFKEKKLEYIHFDLSKCSNFESDSYLDMVHYLIVQYFRTNKRIKVGDSIELLSTTIREATGESATPSNIMFLLIHMHSLNIVDKLIKSKYMLILVKNKTEIPFITSDNPVINTYANMLKDVDLQNLPFEIFFPITPNLAILYTNVCIDPNINKSEMELTIEDKNKVIYFNKLIFKEADRYVFGNMPSSLTP